MLIHTVELLDGETLFDAYLSKTRAEEVASERDGIVYTIDAAIFEGGIAVRGRQVFHVYGDCQHEIGHIEKVHVCNLCGCHRPLDEVEL